MMLCCTVVAAIGSGCTKDPKYRSYFAGNHVYEVSGCNINELQDCGWLRGSRGGPIPWAADCKVVTLPKKKK